MRPDLKNRTSDAFPLETEPVVKTEPPEICEEVDEGDNDWNSAEYGSEILRQSAPQARLIRNVHTPLLEEHIRRNADDKSWLLKKTDGGHLKPFKCDICSINFATTNELASHQWIHTPVPRQDWWEGHRLSVCTKCNIGFRLVDDFFFHQSLHDSTVSCEDDETETKASTESLQREEKDHDIRDELPQEEVKVKLELEDASTECASSDSHQMVEYPEAEFGGKTKDIITNQISSTGRTNLRTTRNSETTATTDDTTSMPLDMLDDEMAESDVVSDKPFGNANSGHLCDFCGKSFQYRSRLKVHLSVHTGEKPFQCQFCNKRFRRKDCMITHERVHTGEKPYSCEDCGHSTTSLSNLNSHRMIHMEEKPYGCDLCPKRFFQERRMLHHQRTAHVTQKLYQCSECDKRFNTKRSLQRHEQTHSEPPPFTCTECNAGFSCQVKLDWHCRRVHRVLQCETCGIIVQSPTVLARHVVTHTDERPFVCSVCGKGFRLKFSLDKHKRRHLFAN